ncbi:hypothetical protein EG349_15805 [Chryseobacterium shandongense]|uniref:Lipoprotein n=1 Tax=Chryseobacterium shandongense TaxID=1493872 RepID=A0AAD0YFW7_9FLAO|nr:hypothetical protein [Chryseobacterium shandongense]AZA88154.1 hypothetical protein EG349_15805 [Chryseobacterium shandongense]AZA96715.1 hypothetical protein EG353_14595 [Chryseobacterium shandongense]
MIRLIVLFICFAIVFSCSTRKDSESKEVLLYKQSTSANDASFSFEKKLFWKINSDENSFVMQKFSKVNYLEISQKIKTFKFIGNDTPEYYNNVNFAFVLYNKNKKNDTLYYDGYNKWWIVEQGKTTQYEDEKNYFTDKLKMIYPIFRNCSYQPSK